MAYTVIDSLLVSPGGAILFTTPIAPTSKVIVRANPLYTLPGVPIGYAEIIVSVPNTPIGAIGSKYKAFFMNDVPLWVPPQPETSPFGGWFVRFYCLNSSNGNGQEITVYVEM